jgi:hypothetical protein
LKLQWQNSNLEEKHGVVLGVELVDNSRDKLEYALERSMLCHRPSHAPLQGFSNSLKVQDLGKWKQDHHSSSSRWEIYGCCLLFNKYVVRFSLSKQFVDEVISFCI